MDVLAPAARVKARAIRTPILRHLLHLIPLTLLSVAAAILAAERPAPGTVILLRVLYGVIVGLNVLTLGMWAWSTVLGALAAVARRAGMRVEGPVLAPPTGRARTVLLLPVYEENAAAVCAAARAMLDALSPKNVGTVDCFVLSDTQCARAVAVEEAVYALAARPDDGGSRLFYRRRADTSGRKAGNIRDFIERWGAQYDFMIVLDADSLMSGEALARLIGAIEANPRAGLIQAMCYPVGRESRFARLQQFSSRLYSPLFQRGVALWQGPRGNFWGHNAVIRISAFAACCGLPTLPGKPPFGGAILSHDTVEAALLLRCGYDVWMLPDGPDGTHDGSWEETPTNLLDHLGRDRRWCRGNLQHVQVLAATRLKLASLYHLTRGLLHYLYAPLLVAWLVLYALIDRSTGADALLWLVLAMIAAPRLLCLAAAMLDVRQAKEFGGRGALAASFLVDQILAALIYPIALVVHLRVLAGMLTGGETGWDGQMRDDRGLTWSAAGRQLAIPVAMGLAGLAALAGVAPLPAALFAPGLLVAVPLAVFSSRRLGSARLLRTPDDNRPNPIRAERRRIEIRLSAGQRIDADGKPCALPADAGLSMPKQQMRWRPPTQSR